MGKEEGDKGLKEMGIDAEALRSLEEELNRPALAKALPVTAQDQVWNWIENSVNLINDLKHAGPPKGLTIEVEPPGLGPRNRPLRRAPAVCYCRIISMFSLSLKHKVKNMCIISSPLQLPQHYAYTSSLRT